MTGLVLVSHSHRVAEAVMHLVREVVGDRVPLAAAGGLDESTPGTNPERIAAAMQRVLDRDGVLVFVDLGSAVLSAEMAVELLAPDERDLVALVKAPLVEGAVIAASVLAAGGSAAAALREAEGALEAKLTAMRPVAEDGSSSAVPEPAEPAPNSQTGSTEVDRILVAVTNRLGLHARPAARLVQEASRFDAEVRVSNQRRPDVWAKGTSLNQLLLLDIRNSDLMLIEVSGHQRSEAAAALTKLAQAGFGEEGPQSSTEGVLPGGAVRPSGAGQTDTGLPSDNHLGQMPHPRGQVVEGSRLDGLPAVPGFGFGPAIVMTEQIPTKGGDRKGSPEHEWERLKAALGAAKTRLSCLQSEVEAASNAYDAAVLETQVLFLNDPALLEPARLAIEAGRSAGSAWAAACGAIAAAYRRLENPVLRQRAADVDDVCRRVLRLLGEGLPPSVATGHVPGVLVVTELLPSDVDLLRTGKIGAVCVAEEAQASHSAILARNVGVPMVAGLGERCLAIAPGTELVVDGFRGHVYVAPGPDLRQQLEADAARRAVSERQARVEATKPAILPSGRRIIVAANIATVQEAEMASRMGAEGIGLLRSEFLFLGRPDPPTEYLQMEAYRRIAEAVSPYPVVLRTLDAGGDKPLPYLPVRTGPNPALGLRGARLTFRYQGVLRDQLRAALRVAVHHPIRLLLPMISGLEELVKARALIEGCRQQLLDSGEEAPSSVDIGVMVEVPSAALTADRLARHADFFSIGSNDLVQYTLAADRANPDVREISDGLHPAVLRLIARVVAGARRHQRPVTICGELASDPEAIPLLIGLGVDELSMAPHAIPTAKALIRRMVPEELGGLVRRALTLDTAEDVRRLARRFLEKLSS